MVNSSLCETSLLLCLSRTQISLSPRWNRVQKTKNRKGNAPACFHASMLPSGTRWRLKRRARRTQLAFVSRSTCVSKKKTVRTHRFWWEKIKYTRKVEPSTVTSSREFRTKPKLLGLMWTSITTVNYQYISRQPGSQSGGWGERLTWTLSTQGTKMRARKEVEGFSR